MPVSGNITELSDSDQEVVEPLPKANPPRAGKKRKRGPGSKQRVDKSSDLNLRSTLTGTCGCKRKCLQQFIEPEVFAKLRDYSIHWHGLHKLDQDQAVFCLHSEFVKYMCIPKLPCRRVSQGNVCHTFHSGCMLRPLMT